MAKINLAAARTSDLVSAIGCFLSSGNRIIHHYIQPALIFLTFSQSISPHLHSRILTGIQKSSTPALIGANAAHSPEFESFPCRNRFIVLWKQRYSCISRNADSLIPPGLPSVRRNLMLPRSSLVARSFFFYPADGCAGASPTAVRLLRC